MTSFPLVPAGLTLVWVALCLLSAVTLLRRRQPGPLLPHQRLLLVGLGLLAIAPVTCLLVSVLTGEPTWLPGGLQLGGAALFFAAAARARKFHDDPELAAGTRPFAEKSAAVVVVGLVIVAVAYFTRAWNASAEQSLTAFVSALAMLIALMIAGHVLIALFHAPMEELNEPTDERDRAISLRGMRNAYYVLVAAFWTIPLIVLVPLPVLTVLNLWFGTLIVAELVYYGSVVVLYRYGTI